MTFIRRLMEIKEEQLVLEKLRLKWEKLIEKNLSGIFKTNLAILKVLEGRKDGKRKISRKN